jgi:hypothetical protein
MNELKKKLMYKAEKQFKQIYPCTPKNNLKECFTVEENQLLFWFNTADESTHVLTQDLA